MIKSLFILLFLSASFGFSQTKENELKEIYNTAIENYINELKKFSNEDVKTLNFIADDVPERYLPKEVNGYTINYFSVYDKKNKTTLKRGLKIISIQPINLSGNTITVNLIDFNVTYSKKNYGFANGGGSKSVFVYSSDNNKWQHKETKYSGI